MIAKHSAIGVFDSGVGGISVLRALKKSMPHENFIFYGDSRHAPYGEKTEEEIREYSEQAFLFLLSRGVKAVVIACNTATSAAADYLRKKYPEKIIIGMEPAVKPAAESSGTEAPLDILVLATASTLSGQRFRQLLSLHEEEAVFHPLPAPGIVRMVEAGKESSPEMQQYLRELLAPYRKRTDGSAWTHIQGLVLGCTHFPFVKRQIIEALGYSPAFYDGADGTARETKHRLSRLALLNDSPDEGRTELFSSLGSTALAERLLSLPLS